MVFDVNSSKRLFIYCEKENNKIKGEFSSLV